MVNISILLLEDAEEAMGMGDLDIAGIERVGQEIARRFSDVGKALRILEQHGWKWASGSRDIYLSKDISNEAAMAELKCFDIPHYLFADFLRVDDTGKPM